MIYLFTLMLITVWITAEPMIKLRMRLSKRFRTCQPSLINTALKMIDCPQCSGFWIALIVSLTYQWIPFWFQFPVIISGAVFIITYLKNYLSNERNF